MLSLFPPPNLSRRTFLKQATLTGLVVGFVVPSDGRLALAQPVPPGPSRLSPNAFLRIGTDESVTIQLAHSEMGQGVWTTLPMLMAEELDADWSKIRVEHAPVADDFNHILLGQQVTGGSTSTWTEFDRYRQVGAMARVLLVQAGAARFGVPVSACQTANGFVIAGAQRASYGQLAAEAAKLPAPTSVELKPAAQWRIIGKPTKRLDAREKIDGTATFGIDVRLPGMLTAVVARSPVFGGTVKSCDDAAALKVVGVRKVVRIPSGVAVVADNFHAASRGRDALVINWDLGPLADFDTQALRRQFHALAAQDGVTVEAVGDARAALPRAARTIEAEYFVPYLAHAPMEPLNCTVRLENGKCEIWTGTQAPSGDRDLAASITGLSPDKIQVHTTFLGGSFGRRGFQSWIGEALHVAKATGGTVKTVWTREDDIRGGYYRPMFVHRAKIGLGADGLPVAWSHTLVGQSVATGGPFEHLLVRNGVDSSSIEGTLNAPYMAAIPDRRIGLHTPSFGVPVQFWRSVGSSHSAFVMESLIDEAAKSAGRDPVEYRRALLKKHPRHLGVLNLAAEKANWNSTLPKGHALGVAVHESFGSYVAQVAEVSVDSGAIRVHRVVCAIDCGVVVNPAGVVAQMESGIVFGLSATLAGAIEFKNGRVQESNFHDYPVLRINQMPVVEVHIVPSTERLGGAGEPATPPIAPAVANAIARLTGQRLRELPLRLTA